MTSYDYPIILIEWLDAASAGDSGWQDKSEMLEFAKADPPKMRTVGFLVHEAPTHYAVMETFGPDECSGVTIVPKGWTVDVVDLTDGHMEPLI